MKIFVNDRPVDLVPGMKVRHGLIRADVLEELRSGKRVCDPWGNEVGLDGSLAEGDRIYVREKEAGA
jgi:hypothetical protein